MLASVGKYVGGKVVTAICVVASGAALLWFYKHPESAQAIWQVVKYSIAWILFAVVLPWSSYAVLPLVLRTESNAVSVVMLAALWLLDVLMALWLCGWEVNGGALSWAVLLLGFIAAGAYNFVVCESLARQLDA